MPTSDDIEMFKSYKGSPSELHMVDQYMLEVNPASQGICRSIHI